MTGEVDWLGLMRRAGCDHCSNRGQRSPPLATTALSHHPIAVLLPFTETPMNFSMTRRQLLQAGLISALPIPPCAGAQVRASRWPVAHV